ncbi:MAG TPA: DUF4384 domain-containing protein [Gemmatimonadales bacterium]|nr:DUF4384 domain-containing protein [Gemmatimonadales bacterium]
MITTILLVSALTFPGSGTQRATADRPRVEVWTNNNDSPYHRGEGARVFVRAEQDGYLTLIRVDTDGRLRVLFPRQPWEDNFVRGGQELAVQSGRDADAFDVDDDPGVGYVFAVVSADPFSYDPIVADDHWDYRTISQGRITGDPYVALTDLAGRITPSGDDAWDYDMVPYYVEQHYDYPRFVCYNCHAFNAWSTWDPYAYSCARYRVVVYDDPSYYPYRYYGGTQVVMARPYRPEPRFVFRDRSGSGDDRFVTVVHRDDRPVNDDQRRGGGVVEPRDRRPDNRPDSHPNNGGEGNHGQRRGGEPDHPDRPDHPNHPDHPDRPDRPDHSPSWERPRPAPSPDRSNQGSWSRPPQRTNDDRPQTRQVENRRETPKRDQPAPKDRSTEERRHRS